MLFGRGGGGGKPGPLLSHQYLFFIPYLIQCGSLINCDPAEENSYDNYTVLIYSIGSFLPICFVLMLGVTLNDWFRKTLVFYSSAN